MAFAFAGFFECLSAKPKQVFAKAFRLAWRAALVGVIIGSVVGMPNALLYERFVATLVSASLVVYIDGVLGGFIIGTFYGAIVGARREIARQITEALASV